MIKKFFVGFLIIISIIVATLLIYNFATKNKDKTLIDENIIGIWYPNDISMDGEEGGRSLSSYFGLNINEKNHFEFYEDKTYIKLLGELNEKGSYEIKNNKVYMTSSLEKTVIIDFDTDENGNYTLIEKDDVLTIHYLKESN